MAPVLLVLVAGACSGATTVPQQSTGPVSSAVSSAPSVAASVGAASVGAASATPTARQGLSATATASTLFDTQRTFRLELVQVGADVEITSLQLSSPWYDDVAPVARDLRLTDGGQRLVPLPYGPADCAAASPPPAGGPVGEVVVGTTDGELRVPLADHPAGLVAGRHDRECSVAAAGRAVELAFGQQWSPADARAVTGTIRVTPSNGQSVEVVRIEGNIIFTLDARDDLPVSADGAVTDVPVRVAAARCDTHALIEAKRKFHHLVEVSIDGAEPVVMEVEATGDTRELFQQLLEACLADPES